MPQEEMAVCSIILCIYLEVETRTYAATLMVLLLAVRARSASLLMTLLLVFEAPAQEGLVRSVPATLGVRSFHRLPAYVPPTFHRSIRAEWSQQEGMSEHRRSL
jgi:hypothetical protein